MHPREALSPGATARDVGVTDAAVARDLADQDVSRHLRLAHPDDVGRLRSAHSDLAHRVHLLELPRSAVHASAGVLILRRGHACIPRATRELRSVRHVAVERNSCTPESRPISAQTHGEERRL